MNAYHDCFVLNLPPEVGSYIFVLSREMEIIEANQHGGSPTLLFGAVCKGWRELALSTPRLWTTLDLRLDNFIKSKRMDVLPHLVSDWLE